MARLPLAPFEKLIKKHGDGLRVSEGATMALIELVEEVSRDVIKDSSDFARHAGRRTILESDILMARKKRFEK